MKGYYKQIDGYATMEDQGELFKTILKGIEPGYKLKIAEVGVYKGRMTALICELLSDMKIRANYFCIDHFRGSAEHNRKDYYPEFWETINNMPDFDIAVLPVVSNSVEAASTFEDGYFDIVYLDASHDYESVKSDITAWQSKVKTGGILCGDDYIRGWDGVIKAVNECLGKENIKRVANQQWYIKI